MLDFLVFAGVLAETNLELGDFFFFFFFFFKAVEMMTCWQWLEQSEKKEDAG
jgi:hypothetical protein